MKKALSLLLVLVIITGSFLILPTGTYAENNINVVYLDGINGAEANSGETPATAVASLKTAFTRLGTDGGIVVVSGDTIIDSDLTTDEGPTYDGHNIILPSHTGKIYITSNNGSKLRKTIIDKGTTLTFNGPVEFFNITFNNETTNQNLNLYANGNTFTMGYGVVCLGTLYPKIYGLTQYNNKEAQREANTNISVYSGTWGEITGVGPAPTKLSGNATINLYGGTFAVILAGGNAGVIGNTEVNIYKGANNSPTVLTKVVVGTTGSNKTTTVTGTRTLNLYNGISIDEAPQTDTSRVTFSHINRNLSGVVPIPDSSKLNRSYYAEFAKNSDYFGTMSGAQTRLSTPSGLRFTSIITKSYFDNLVTTYGAGNVTLGTIITPLCNITDEFTIDALTTAGKLYLNIEQTKYVNETTAETDGYYKFNAAIVNIKGTEEGFNNLTDTDNRSVNFAARAYIKIVQGENTTYIYRQFDFGANVRNVAYVANAAVNDTGAGYTPDQLATLNKFIP